MILIQSTSYTLTGTTISHVDPANPIICGSANLYSSLCKEALVSHSHNYTFSTQFLLTKLIVLSVIIMEYYLFYSLIAKTCDSQCPWTYT